MTKSLSIGAVGVALALSFGTVPAHAGFFDQLFGGGGSAPSAPAPTYSEPGPSDGFDQLHVSPPRAHKHVAAREATPVRQMPTDLMHDKTLRAGDAVMMKDGFHIYNGPRIATHSPRQFVPIEEASHVSASARETLAAIDNARNEPMTGGHAPGNLASGRSAAVSTPISKGFKITDARGASIRYVGP